MSAPEPIAPTEQRNPRTTEMDLGSSPDVVRLLLSEDLAGVGAALTVSEELGQAADLAADRLGASGRLHYFGAGASGRLAMLDATEITPTFGVTKELFCVHFPGGAPAVLDSSTDLEDSEASGHDDASCVAPGDIVVGVTASGTTPYVRGALNRAKAIGCASVLITMWDEAPLCREVDIAISPRTGPEALTGSTRLKAGTATKVLLNALSTTIMVRLGMTYSNFMIGLKATNDKLRARSVRILTDVTARPADECRQILDASNGDVRVALVCLLSESSPTDAARALKEQPQVGLAVAQLAGRAQ